MSNLQSVAFELGLLLNATLTRSRRAQWVESSILTPLTTRLTRWMRGAPHVLPGSSARGLGREWERLIGDRRYARIVHVDEATATAYGEIVGRCPLRGTGDLAACHRLMAFDRGLMEPYRARLVVLQSQAEPGKNFCKVAIRTRALDASDLVPAHERCKAAPSEPVQ